MDGDVREECCYNFREGDYEEDSDQGDDEACPMVTWCGGVLEERGVCSSVFLGTEASESEVCLETAGLGGGADHFHGAGDEGGAEEGY